LNLFFNFFIPICALLSEMGFRMFVCDVARLQVDVNQMTQTWGVEVGKVELYVMVLTFSSMLLV